MEMLIHQPASWSDTSKALAFSFLLPTRSFLPGRRFSPSAEFSPPPRKCYSSCVITLRVDLHTAVMFLESNFHSLERVCRHFFRVYFFFLSLLGVFWGLWNLLYEDTTSIRARAWVAGHLMHLHPCCRICRRTILRAHPGRGRLTTHAHSLT